jgi:hypothetical protein
MKRLASPLLCAALFLLPGHAPAGAKDDLKPANLEKLNTAADEVDPFAVDGSNLLYATNEAGKFEVRLSKRASLAAPWPPGKVFRPFLSSTEYDCRSPAIWKGTNLFFAQNKVPDKKFEALRNFDIYQAIGERAPTPLLGIGEREDEIAPCVAAGGKELYFSRNTKDGWLLFVAAGPVPGPIGKARPVGFAEGFYHASVSPSGLSMFLQGTLADGKAGLYHSKRASLTGKWSDPEPVRKLNTSDGKAGDSSPNLSPDGSRLFFVSDRSGGKGGLDLWTVLVKDLK